MVPFVSRLVTTVGATLQFVPLYPPVHEYVQLPGVALYVHACPTEVGLEVRTQRFGKVGLVAQEFMPEVTGNLRQMTDRPSHTFVVAKLTQA